MSLQAQLDLEREMCAGGRAKMAAALNNNEDSGRASSNPYAQALFRQYVLPLSAAVAADITLNADKPGRHKAHAVGLLGNMDPDAVAFIAVRTTLNAIMELSSDDVDPAASKVSLHVGRSVYREIALTEFEELSPDLYHAMINDLKAKMSKDERHRMTVFQLEAKKQGLTLPEWGESEKVHIGGYLLDQLHQLGMVVLERGVQYRNGKRKDTLTVRLSDETMETIHGITEWLTSMTTDSMPCVYPPRPWVTLDDGGYHGSMRRVHPRAIKTASNRIEIMQELGTDLTVVLRMLNYHQSRRWRVNRFVLDVIKQSMGKQGFETEEIISAQGLPKPERPGFLDTGAELTVEQELLFKQWKRSMADWHSAMKVRGALWGRLNLSLRIAERFLDQELYFVYQVDSRGRMYPITRGVNPQGSDMQRALLHSAEGFPVPDGPAFDWFRIHGANLYGVDKETLPNRIKWVQDNAEAIKACALNPAGREEFNWWSQADKPMQFIAWCDEFYRRSLSPSTFMSHLTAGMDGSCNGLQNFSAMLRDPVGGRSTNLIPNSLNKGPEDIYADVARVTERILNLELATDETGWCARWLRAGINRTLVKRSVMTLPYGSTRFSCADFIVQDYLKAGKTDQFQKHEFHPAAQWLSHRVWQAIGEVVVKATEAMKYLQGSARKILKQSKCISWVAPTGFRVVQLYNKVELQRVRTRLLGTTTIALRKDTDEPDPNRHRNGIAPNFVHSIDASHMAFVTIAAEDAGIPFLSMVHDDFGAPFLYAEELYKIIREEFIRLHRDFNPLQAFADAYGLPAPPDRGDLDLERVRESLYFFS